MATDDKYIQELPALTTPATSDIVVVIKDPISAPVARQVTLENVLALLGGGTVKQIVGNQTGTMATGTTVIPADNTIPQITEGTQFMSQAVTPTSATNKLRIDVTFVGTSGTSVRTLCVALFQDATANAIACAVVGIPSSGYMQTVRFSHTMTAGTTSATTFYVRAGVETSGTVTFNGAGGAQFYGGVLASSITITEYEP